MQTASGRESDRKSENLEVNRHRRYAPFRSCNSQCETTDPRERKRTTLRFQISIHAGRNGRKYCPPHNLRESRDPAPAGLVLKAGWTTISRRYRASSRETGPTHARRKYAYGKSVPAFRAPRDPGAAQRLAAVFRWGP